MAIQIKSRRLSVGRPGLVKRPCRFSRGHAEATQRQYRGANTDVGIGATRWPTFNVADSAITVGAIALAVSLWLEGRAQERAKEAGAAQH